MGTLTGDGATAGVMKYTDGSEYIKIVIAHIVTYGPIEPASIMLETVTGPIKLNLADEAAVSSAIAALDAQF